MKHTFHFSQEYGIHGFEMTIHKCQSRSFNKVDIYLPEQVFAYGQLYVAFSRVKIQTISNCTTTNQ